MKSESHEVEVFILDKNKHYYHTAGLCNLFGPNLAKNSSKYFDKMVVNSGLEYSFFYPKTPSFTNK